MHNERFVSIVGMGELGGVFARGLLKSGMSVRPALRGSDLQQAAQGAELVLICVGEDELDGVLSQLSGVSAVGLVQNELLPSRWQKHGVESPTICVVWFEKKPGRDVHVVRKSGIYGPQSGLLLSALNALDISAYEIPEQDLVYELVLKNLYILTLNTIGLVTTGSVGEVWENQRERMLAVAQDILKIQFCLVESKLDEARLIQGLSEAVASDPAHGCLGRTARTRLSRALGHAAQFGLEVPALRDVAAESRLER